MSFLPRLFVVIGLSFVFTLLLMVVLSEPERPAGASTASAGSPAASAPAPSLVSGIR